MNQEQIDKSYQLYIESEAYDKFVGVDNAELQKMFEAYCNSDGHLDFDDAVNFAGVIQGEMIKKNIKWIAELVHKSVD